MLSQLSYSPIQVSIPDRCHSIIGMVGPGRLELPTSRLSGVRSNHLSYRPITRPAMHTGWPGFLTLKGYEDGPAVICGILISDAC